MEYLKDSLHIFPENAPASIHITTFKSIESHLYKIQAIDRLSNKVTPSKIKHVLKRNQSETNGLVSTIQI